MGDVTILGPHPLLSVTIERHPDGADEIHLHPAGQGVWVARMAAALGAHPVLCGYLGGETGAILGPLIDALPCERRMIASATDSGSYVYDRRSGERDPIAHALSPPPGRHEIDDLVAATVASALQTRLLVLCNPYPGDALGPEVYERIAADAHAHGVRVLADLSSPRLDGALRGGVDLVKINDWELAGFVTGPVGEDDELAAAVGRIREHGVETVVITRGELPAAVFGGDEQWTLTAPSFDHGFREGCGDSMMGATAAILAAGGDWREALTIGAAAGAVNFLHRGLGTGDADAIRELASSVQLVRTAG
ncbi:PfkB family carbohydrate kinase [Svornostia abyssi]|uniref:PfkB family carbohydrate kinase n=1 Tax=Svornostia abyssi TaxID=2898438 RepID=A0ABY5PHV0_9ACTN|nr:PfkB family carbohydrate kinase [Parviterribacteraceae bacterium J379]